MKRVFLITGAGIIIVCVLSMQYLLQTEAGLQWLIKRASHSVTGLSIASAQGRLSGPLQLRGIQYTSGDSSYGIDEFALDWKLSRLIYLEAHISTLKLQGVNIITAGQPAEAAPAEPASELPDVNFPLKIVVKRAIISNISIIQSSESKPVTIHTVSLKGRVGPKTIRINQFDIDMPELTLTAKGKISPHDNYPMDIALSWNVRIPEFKEISGKGNVAGNMKLINIKQSITAPFQGSANIKVSDVIKNINWEGKISLSKFNAANLNGSWPDVNLAGDINGEGSAMNADISSLSLRISDGYVAAKGSVSWQPDITWSLNVNAESLNPGVLWPEWQGALDVTARSAGQYAKDALTIRPSEVTIEGELRDRPIKVHTKLSAVGSQLELSTLEVSSGASHVSATGKLADTLSLIWEMYIKDAADLLPHLKGEISGSGSVEGTRSFPVIKGTLNGSTLSYDTYSAKSIKAVVDIDTKDERGSLLDIQVDNVILSGQVIEKFSLKGSGMVSSHAISIYAAMDNENIDMLVEGGYRDESWSGKLNNAAIDSVTFGRWNLREPASISVSKIKADADMLCLISNGALLCFQTSWDSAAGVMGKLLVTALPLSMAKTFLPSMVTTDGTLNADGEISYTPEGRLSGNLSLIIPSGKLQYQADEKPVDISIGKSQVDIKLSETALDAQAEIVFPDRGQIKGEINLPGFMSGVSDTSDQQIIGHVAAEMNNLDLIPVFVPLVSKASGAVVAHVQMNGTFSETAITGDMRLQEGTADIPDMGLKLRDINVALKGDAMQMVTIEGRLSSGKGHVSVNGTVGLQKEKTPSAVIRIQGENVEVIKIPGTWITASPDVDLRIENNMINFAGSMTIPQALLEPPDISGAVLPSKEVIVVDMPADKKESTWSQAGKFKLALGDNVRFKGYGLTCRITGGIDITEEPGKITQGHGELQVVEGKYKAYGQDLAIEKGRLIFAGLLDDPGLDIKAFRTIKDLTAGVNVQGTLKTPEFYVYSVPTMDESDALSYVLFGRPMTQLSGSEGNKLYGAALSAGLSAGGFAAKKIGAAFGVEDIEIANGDTPEQATLFIGKYLSPRLYLSYGIGLFEPVSTIRLRYDLTRSLEVQTEYGLESGGDVLYTIER